MDRLNSSEYEEGNKNMREKEELCMRTITFEFIKANDELKTGKAMAEEIQKKREIIQKGLEKIKELKKHFK